MRAALALVLLSAFAARVASAQETQQDIAERIVREQMELRAKQVQKVASAPERAMGGSTMQPYTVEAPGGAGPAAPKPPAPKKDAGGFPTWIVVACLIPVALLALTFLKHKKPPSQEFTGHKFR